MKFTLMKMIKKEIAWAKRSFLTWWRLRLNHPKTYHTMIQWEWSWLTD